jgi:hypothetical protein
LPVYNLSCCIALFSPSFFLERFYLTTGSSYIQMSAMIFGGMIEADARMVRYHQAVRSHKKLQSDMAAWRAYENEFEERGTPGVAGESAVGKKK